MCVCVGGWLISVCVGGLISVCVGGGAYKCFCWGRLISVCVLGGGEGDFTV